MPDIEMFVDEDRKIIGRLTLADVVEGSVLFVMWIGLCLILWRWG